MTDFFHAYTFFAQIILEVTYQTRDSVSSGYLNAERGVQNTTRRRVFLVKFELHVWHIYLPGVLKTGFGEVLSGIQLIAGNLSGQNLLKHRDVFGVEIKISGLQD